ncbi:magnesium transporter MRS2-F-like isoform X3 [Diospyros lotus]|uniref:magnesium transporter MRS2-F-like isoform X3 n=1 Tax=Diospyros lotus TaxID=55363 RepID=UPI00225A2EB6|nr:magnesium transporter MRS2-F-like isoform X3 [Diospyros lotus]
MEGHPPAAAAARRKGIGTRVWLVVSESGESHMEEVGKHSIMRRTGLPGRDLRVLDPMLSYPSTILGRERAIVLNLEHIKAIITAKEVLMINSTNPLLVNFIHHLQEHVSSPRDSAQQEKGTWGSPSLNPHVMTKQNAENDSPSNMAQTLVPAGSKSLPFEFRALEACLESACRCLESEVRDELEHLLDDDNDMAEMYLTEKLVGHSMEHTSREEVYDEAPEDGKESGQDSESEHNSAILTAIKPNIEELEMLLEAYFAQIDGISQKLFHMSEYVDDTEDFINIMLDEKQNQLLQMGVMLSTANMILNAGIVVVGLFGMNISISLFEGKPIQFWETTFGTVGGCVALYLIAIGWGRKKKLV